MQYYMIEWDHEEADDPWRLFLELDDKGSLRRKIEVFRGFLADMPQLFPGTLAIILRK